MRSTLDVLRYYAAHAPSRVALRCARGEWTYRQLLDAATAIARALEPEGVRVLGLAADNGPSWVAADLAAQVAGIALVPLPPHFSREQMRRALRDSGADGVLADRSFCPQIAAACGDAEAALAMPSNLYLYRLPTVRTGARLPPDTAKVAYTGGTTGEPKGVCLSQDALDGAAHSLWAATAGLDLAKHLCVLPLAVPLENVAGIYAALRNGASIAVPSLRDVGFAEATGVDVERLVTAIATYAPHSIVLVPQTLAALVAALEAGAPRPESLRFAAVIGGRVSQALLERAERVALPVYEGYGLAECASIVALSTPAARRSGSAGRVLPHASVRIDERSEIRVAGAAVCGYVGAAANAPDEVATGDIGRIDADGFLYVTGRRKHAFITSFGRHVSPEGVEAELARAAPIAQAALFGDSRAWNTAVIVPATPAARAHEIQRAVDAVNRDLPDYARVRDWIRADEPFTSANGLATADGRNRRAAIWNRYRARIDACYFESIAV